MKAALALALAGAAASAAAQPLTPSEIAGRSLYYEGKSMSGRPVRAVVGMASSPMPGAVVACVNCHGADGLGRPEGGVTPSPITWTELSKSYGHVHDTGRRHPAFDEHSFFRAMAEGLDPAGNRLDPAMPRFALHQDDLRDLVAYLKRLENDPDPGLTESTLRVGTVLPSSGPLAAAGKAMREAIEAVFMEANSAGGLYGRQLELVVRPHAPQPEAALGAARELMEKDRVFALVSPFALAAEEGFAALAEERRIPVVGLFTVRGPQSATGRYTFYLFSGTNEQAEVLTAYALEHHGLKRAPFAIVHTGEALAAAQAAAARCAQKGCASTVRLDYREGAFDAAATVARARDANAEAVLFLGPAADLARFAAQAAAAQWFPTLLTPGMLGGRAVGQLPSGFEGRVFLAYPSSPRAAAEDTAQEGFTAFLAKHRIEGGNALPVYSGYLAASLFVDALRRAGKALGRERLVATLEGTTDYRSGLAHPLRFGPQRRIGVLGGHVVAPAPDRSGFRIASGWIQLD